MDEVISARSLGELKGRETTQYEEGRLCKTCQRPLSIYNPNKNCGSCYTSGKVETR